MSLKRQDGRSEVELREITIDFGELHGVDGSARFGFGESNQTLSFLKSLYAFLRSI